MDKTREEFEAWYLGHAKRRSGSQFSPEAIAALRDGNAYKDAGYLQSLWESWQAARRPMPGQGEAVALKVGQRVRRLDGAEVIIDKDDGTNTPYRADGLWYRRDGTCPGAPERSLVLPIADPAPLASDSGRVAELSVWYGAMPETNGKTNWTAILCRDGDITSGFTFARSEYEDRVRYEADYMRFLIGEITERPDLMAYDSDKHSGYVSPPSTEVARIADLESQLAELKSAHDIACDAVIDITAQLAESREREGRMREALSVCHDTFEWHRKVRGVDGALAPAVNAVTAALAADKEQKNV